MEVDDAQVPVPPVVVQQPQQIAPVAAVVNQQAAVDARAERRLERLRRAAAARLPRRPSVRELRALLKTSGPYPTWESVEKHVGPQQGSEGRRQAFKDAGYRLMYCNVAAYPTFG